MITSILLSILLQAFPWYFFPASGNPKSVDGDAVEVKLILPLGSAGQVRNNDMMEFYCGVLCAVRDLDKEGVKISLDVEDIAPRADSSRHKVHISDPDIIIGPVKGKDIASVYALCKDSSFVISPLDPGVAAMTDSSRIIQVPSPSSLQMEEFVKWVAGDCIQGDEVVVYAPDSLGKDYLARMRKALDSSFVAYRVIHDLNPEDYVTVCTGTTRLLIGTDRDSEVRRAVRAAALLAMTKSDMEFVLYGPSKIKSFDNIPVEHIHYLQAQICSTYSIDYLRDDVRDFVHNYRSLFHCEPGQFAFHGYDVTRYFVSAYVKFGDLWTSRLGSYCGRGLQCDFRFAQKEGSRGFVNTAFRRTSYNKDLSISVSSIPVE